MFKIFDDFVYFVDVGVIGNVEGEFYYGLVVGEVFDLLDFVKWYCC